MMSKNDESEVFVFIVSMYVGTSRITSFVPNNLRKKILYTEHRVVDYKFYELCYED